MKTLLYFLLLTAFCLPKGAFGQSLSICYEGESLACENEYVFTLNTLETYVVNNQINVSSTVNSLAVPDSAAWLDPYFGVSANGQDFTLPMLMSNEVAGGFSCFREIELNDFENLYSQVDSIFLFFAIEIAYFEEQQIVPIVLTTDTIKLANQANLTVDVQEESAEQTEFTTFPNPTTGPVTVNGLKDVDEEVFLTDASGRIVTRIQTYGKQSIELDLSGLKSGMYSIFLPSGRHSNIVKN